MLARAYDTPCPVDVIEKVLEGARNAVANSIHTIGQQPNQWVYRPK